MINKKQISFTKYERTCPDHVATTERLCYCARISDDRLKLCSKANCPKFRKPEEESE